MSHPVSSFESSNRNLNYDSFTTPGKALSISMSNSKIDILNLVERLEGILARLDENGHAIAAIKVEEAINALQQAEGLSEQTDNG